MTEFKNAMSVAKLADLCGVPRQKIYNLINRGTLKPETIGGQYAFSPQSAALVIDAVRHVRTQKGTRVRFDFV